MYRQHEEMGRNWIDQMHCDSKGLESLRCTAANLFFEDYTK